MSDWIACRFRHPEMFHTHSNWRAGHPRHVIDKADIDPAVAPHICVIGLN